MRRVLTALLALAACQPAVELDRVEQLTGALELVSAANSPAVLAALALDAGVVTGACARMFDAAQRYEARDSVFDSVMEACGLSCPSRAQWDTLRALPAAEQARAFAQACGPDPVFGGSLAGMAAGMDLQAYVAHRHLYERLQVRLSVTPRGEALWRRIDRTRPKVAMALDREAAEVPDSPVSATDIAGLLATGDTATPLLAGDIDTHVIAARLEAEEPTLRACLDARPSEPAPGFRDHRDAVLVEWDPYGAPGSRILLELVIGGNGALWSAEARDTNLTRAAERCVLDRIRGLRFSTPRDGDVAVLAWLLTLKEPAVRPARQAAVAVRPARQPAVEGALPRGAVNRVVSENMRRIRYCYQRALATEPDLAGELMASIVVGADGTVTSAYADSGALAHTQLEFCVAGQFSRMRFPTPGDGRTAHISYPLEFLPRSTRRTDQSREVPCARDAGRVEPPGPRPGRERREPMSLRI